MAQTRVSLINAIKTPLGFFSLIALIVEAMLGGLAWKLNSPNLGYAAVALLALLIIVVGILTLTNPGSLSGKNETSIDEKFAVGLGEEFYTALYGYYDGLKPDDREEAYRFLEGLLKSSLHAHTAEQKKFCGKVAETVVHKANLIHRDRE